MSIPNSIQRISAYTHQNINTRNTKWHNIIAKDKTLEG